MPDRMCEAVRRTSSASRSDDGAVNAALRRGGLDARGGYPAVPWHRAAAESMNLHVPQETQTLVVGSPAQRAETWRLRHGIVSVLPAER